MAGGGTRGKPSPRTGGMHSARQHLRTHSAGSERRMKPRRSFSCCRSSSRTPGQSSDRCRTCVDALQRLPHHGPSDQGARMLTSWPSSRGLIAYCRTCAARQKSSERISHETTGARGARSHRPVPVLHEGVRPVHGCLVPRSGRALEGVPALHTLRVWASGVPGTALLEGCAASIPAPRVPATVLVLPVSEHDGACVNSTLATARHR